MILARSHVFAALLVMFMANGKLLCAQHTVTFEIVKIAGSHQSDTIYVAGDFNGWNPSSARGKYFKRDDSTLVLVIDSMPGGEHQFKFTRGGWDRVEVMPDGTDIGNRIVSVNGDTVFQFSVAGWKDDFLSKVKEHTVSKNVRILDTAFSIPQLDRKRRVWIYLPPGYEQNRKRYPVIYMQDGQNVFDEYTAAFGEWGVDEVLDSVISKKRQASIIVAVDNGPGRMNEYNPYTFRDFGKGEGDEYVDFLALTLKPYIDKHYRTKPSVLNTVVAGSSMGGLISYYALLKYPTIFGKGGIFSPSIWTAEKIKNLTDSMGSKLTGKIFFYMGGLEGEEHINNLKDITDKLGENSSVLIYSVIDPKAGHNENAWRKWFPEFYNWILAPGFNYVIKVED